MEEGTNPLSKEEMHFARTCCRILKINEKERINSIGVKALKDGRGKVQATMSAIRRNLDTLSKEAESYRRESPGRSHTTHNWDNLDAPTHSLQYSGRGGISARDIISAAIFRRRFQALRNKIFFFLNKLTSRYCEHKTKQVEFFFLNA